MLKSCESPNVDGNFDDKLHDEIEQINEYDKERLDEKGQKTKESDNDIGHASVQMKSTLQVNISRKESSFDMVSESVYQTGHLVWGKFGRFYYPGTI